MSSWTLRNGLFLVCLVVFLGESSQARAQDYVSTPSSARGEYINQIEQARITRELAYQERVRTRKAIFDEMLHEKSMTPTNLEKTAKQKADRLEHILKFATANEITSGEALNVLLPYLQGLANHGVEGPPVPLSKEVLKEVTVGLEGKSNIQMLRRGSTIFWPLATRGPEQQHLAGLLTKAVDAAIDGTLDAKLYKDLRTDLSSIRAEVNRQSDKQEISIRAYFDAKYFLDGLDGALSTLQQSNVGKFLDGTYAARGSTVPELIQNMADQGVVFAPALPGAEAPYRSLYNAMVTYVNGAETSSAFEFLK
jgi:hypothetical protein